MDLEFKKASSFRNLENMFNILSRAVWLKLGSTGWSKFLDPPIWNEECKIGFILLIIFYWITNGSNVCLKEKNTETVREIER